MGSLPGVGERNHGRRAVILHARDAGLKRAIKAIRLIPVECPHDAKTTDNRHMLND
jgi:hypothetical protein